MSYGKVKATPWPGMLNWAWTLTEEDSRPSLPLVHAQRAGADQGAAVPHAILDQLAEKLTHRSLIVMLSDFFDDIDNIKKGLRHLRYKKHEIMAFQVLDPAEEDLPFDGHVKFEGLEAEGQHTVRRVETVRTAYGARLAAQKEGLQRLARPADWTVHLHRTDRPPQTVLLSLYLAMADLRRLNAA